MKDKGPEGTGLTENIIIATDLRWNCCGLS